MLYHAAVPEQAVAEIRRVLRPDGDAVVVLNGRRHLGALRDEVDRASGRMLAWETVATEDAEPLLRRHFAEVEVHPRTTRLLVTDPEAVATYVDSMGSLRGGTGPPWSEVVDHCRAWAAAEIAGHGHAEIHTDMAVFVCGSGS
jgi:SAM-dependent methyltransferase